MSSLSLTCSFKKTYCIDMEVIQLFTSSTFYRNQSQAHKLIMLVRSLLPNLGRGNSAIELFSHNFGKTLKSTVLHV